MKTKISTDRSAAVELLRRGEVVALPTETVYGLAADALDANAVAKIFEAKERPRFDPLIIHISQPNQLERVAIVYPKNRELVARLIHRFWPGPFTLVLPKREMIPDLVTAGLETVAVRLSAHPILSQIITELGNPLAAPSANRFGRISPTTAQHVFEELNGRIPLIVDGGPTQHGIESTIVAVGNGTIEILRRGPITAEQLAEFGKVEIASDRSIGFQPMSSVQEVSIRQGAALPHWTHAEATYAVTFRLADSLPKSVVDEWLFERRDILLRSRQQQRELTKQEQDALAKLSSAKIDRFLDDAHGRCWMRNQKIAQIVRDTLFHFSDQRYRLFAWCIMPNHVHVIVQPTSGNTLPQILHSWKSFSSKEANRVLGRRGQFWQAESYDHLIRDEEDFLNQISYVLENPEKAGLDSWPWVGLAADRSHRQAADATIISAPGQLRSHYAPNTPLILIDDATQFRPKSNQRVGLLAWNKHRTAFNDSGYNAVRHLSEKHDLREAASNLFRYLRELDQLGVDLIIAERVPDRGIGSAINDRLQRASGGGD